MGVRYFGAAVPRLEDPKLIVGRGFFIDDLALSGMLHVAFVRSSHAHGIIRSVDTTAAKSIPGVVAAYQAADLGEAASKPIGPTMPTPQLREVPSWAPLASHEVCHVGEAIAVVIAETRAAAEDGAAVVLVDIDPLAACTDLETALAPDASRVHEGAADNLVATLNGRFGDPEAVFAGAPHRFRECLRMHRGGCHAMECRGVVAAAMPGSKELIVWTSTQSPYLVRRAIAGHLELDERDVRVIAPDVGGGFGPKAVLYPEEIVLPILARTLGRPMKWVEDRREHFVATTQQRDQIWDLEVAADEDGRMLAVRGHCLHDNGAYLPYGLVLAGTAISSFPGPYALTALDITLDVVMTNFVPTTPVRGAGRPNVAFALERLADRIARELKLDPTEVRRRSFIRKDQFPYLTGLKNRDGSPATYDSGDFHACLNRAIDEFGVGNFRARQAAARSEGRCLGMGIASYSEDTGLAPFEGATIRIEPTGKAVVETGAASQGQGHATVFAQITADILGITPQDVTVRSADTGVFPLGIGTIASRVAVTGGSSVHLAASALRDKVIKVAAGILEAAEEDLVLEDGSVRVAGADLKIPLGEIASRLGGRPGIPMPTGITPGLSETAYFEARQMTFASGTHVAEVEVDTESGAVVIRRYVVAHDCGRLINPTLVEGQVRGGVVHGIGNALFEQMTYDQSGQPTTTNYGEYLLPTAPEMPRIEIFHLETPSPLNPIGVKGAGEGGTIPAAACIIAAVEDALAHLNVHIAEHPITPQRITELIQDTMVGPEMLGKGSLT